MFSVDLLCPGPRDNVVPLFVGALDASGTLLSDIEAPGAILDHFEPPEDAASIYAVCHNDCGSTAILVYDDPDLVA